MFKIHKYVFISNIGTKHYTYIFEGEADIGTNQMEDSIDAFSFYTRKDGLEGMTDVFDCYVFIKDDMEWKGFEEEFGTHWK